MLMVLLLDALRHDYVGPGCPFLESLAQSGLRGVLTPSFGFEPDAAYLAGLHPDEADGAAQFWYDPSRSPFRFVRSWPDGLDRMPRLAQRILRRLLRAWARRQCLAPQLSTARIPFRLLPHFALSAQVGLDQPSFCPVKTIFDHLGQARRTWLYHGVPTRGLSAEAALQRAETDLRPPVDFAYFLIGDLDRVGHLHGPDSPERAAEMRRVDRVLQRLHTVASARFEELHFLVFGDHGMCSVANHVNVQEALDSLGCCSPGDYLVFLDSTMARFWFFQDSARAEIQEALGALKGGHWISQDERNKYHLNFGHNRFGDAIYLADPGTLILPNYHQDNEPARGMHGYAPDTLAQQSAFILHSPRVQTPRHLVTTQDMRRLFPTILDLLKLPVPGGVDLRSLLLL